MGMRILNEDEGRKEFRRLMEDYVEQEFVEHVSVPGANPAVPSIVVPRPPGLATEFEWEAREIGLGLHSVITLVLRPPETHMAIPLCLVNPRGRDLARLFAETTRPPGGKFNARPARMNLLLREGETLQLVKDQVTLQLPAVCMMLVSTWLMKGQEAIDRFSDSTCPWCGPGQTPPVWGTMTGKP